MDLFPNRERRHRRFLMLFFLAGVFRCVVHHDKVLGREILPGYPKCHVTSKGESRRYIIVTVVTLGDNIDCCFRPLAYPRRYGFTRIVRVTWVLFRFIKNRSFLEVLSYLSD